MKQEEILCLVVAFFLGYFLSNMMRGNVVEGYCTERKNITGWHPRGLKYVCEKCEKDPTSYTIKNNKKIYKCKKNTEKYNYGVVGKEKEGPNMCEFCEFRESDNQGPASASASAPASASASAPEAHH
jgi:hypothetical protein